MNSVLRQSWPGLAAIAAAWFWLWFHLSVEWRLNPQYEYGFAVPVLAGLLLWNRLPRGDRPSPAPAEMNLGRILCWAAIFPLFAGEFIRQADPFWRFGGWLLHAGATLLTFGFLHSWGGRQWTRPLLAPVLFLSLAVPWPSILEGKLTINLLAIATRIAVDCLNWIGLPALQRGNVIELSNGLVGIDDACSGIQSLLSSLMASIFLGAYLQLTRARRVLLLITGVVTAVIGNVVRIIVLTKAVHQHGQAGFEKAHDPVGMWASTGIFLVLGIVAWILRPKIAASPTGGPVAWPGQSPGYVRVILPTVLLLPLVVGLVWQSIAGTRRDTLDAPHWKVRTSPPPEHWTVRADSFSDEEQRLLQFTEGGAWFFKRGPGAGAYVVHLFWSPERTIPTQAFGHSAQVCLPSSGWKPMGSPAMLEVTVGTNKIAGTLGFFEQDADRQAVFQATWRGSSLKPAATQLTGSRWARLTHLKDAYRQRGHEMLTVYIPAPLAANNPSAAFSTFLNLVLAPATNSPPAQP